MFAESEVVCHSNAVGADTTQFLTLLTTASSHLTMASEGAEPDNEKLIVKLTEALEAWREKASYEWLNADLMDFHGGAAVMSDKVLQNIVSSAAQGRLTSVDALKEETRWSRSLRYGAEVLDIVHLYFPPKVVSIPSTCNPNGDEPDINDSTTSTSTTAF